MGILELILDRKHDDYFTGKFGWESTPLHHGRHAHFHVGKKYKIIVIKLFSNIQVRDRAMVAIARSVKILAVVNLVSLLGYVFYVFKGSWTIFFGYLTNVPSDVSYVRFTGSVFWGGHIGLTARFIGVLLGLSAVFLLWVKKWPFSKVKKIVALALIFEAVNFIGLAPSVWYLLRPGFVNSLTLAANYLLQVLLLVPVLLVLAVQVLRYQKTGRKRGLWLVASAAFVCYVSELVVNEGSRWIGMVSSGGLSFLSQGIWTVGFFNAIVFMPFAVVFAVVGAVRIAQRKGQSAMWWLGASLGVVGLNYTIYLGVSYLTNSLNTLPLVDVWTIPLLGLGIAIMLNSRHKDAVNYQFS